MMSSRSCLGALFLSSAIVGNVQGMSLAEAYEASRTFDAQYRSASFELESARQSVPIARAALRPNVVLNASQSEVQGNREFSNGLNQAVRVPLEYSSPQASLQMRVPILNYEALTRLRQAGQQVLGAEAVFEFRGLELADRVGAAYVQVLLAAATVEFSTSELAALQGQLDRAKQRQLRGEGTRTEVAQTQAGLDLARVRLIESQNQLDLASRSLRRLTGKEISLVRDLASDFMPGALMPSRLQEWVDLAEQQSLMLRVRRQNVSVAKLNVTRSRSGHMPRLDLVAGLVRSRNESLSSLNQTSTQRSIGLQLNVPIYSGGGVDAAVDQALADLQRAEEDLRAERESTQVEVQRHFSAAANGAAKVEAYRLVLASSETALEGATRSLAGGLGTQADVLDTQARRFMALRDLAQARYEFLVSRMRLMLQVGMPATELVSSLDSVLTVESPLKTRSTP